MLKLIAMGAKYSRILPRERLLLHIFPESRVQAYLDFAVHSIPPLLALFAVMAYVYRHTRLLAVFVSSDCVLLLSLAMCYAYLGYRSLLPLAGGPLELYRRLCDQNGRAGLMHPTRSDLAREMGIALKQGRREFLELL
ncbi:MAG: DUF412 family protein [Succinivibrionaceae bacterium]|nr:DUF412 family protein [Succinivibrionaceae bacterium]